MALGGRRERMAALGGVILLLVIIVMTAWAHHSLSSAPPAPPRPAVHPVRTSGQSTGMHVRAWVTDAQPSISALFRATDEVAAAVSFGDIAATGAACQSADAAVANVQKHLPSPDPAVNSVLQQAITNYQVGIRRCTLAVRNNDTVDLGEATVYLHRGCVDLQRAVTTLQDDVGSETRDDRVLTA